MNKMCGILALINGTISKEYFEKKLETLKHRGPDFSGQYYTEDTAIGHRRLAIVDPKSGAQPFKHYQYYLSANGEIVNHEELRKEYLFDYTTKSDCEVIFPVMIEEGQNGLLKLRGQFAFVMIFPEGFYAAVDYYGIVPLYYGLQDTSVWFSSEVRCLLDVCDYIEQIPPGHVYSEQGKYCYYNPIWKGIDPPFYEPDCYHLRRLLEKSVKRNMMSDTKWGVLLSGGLDSSLVAAIAQRHSKIQLHSFSIGMEGSKDLIYAKKVAEFINTKHHEIHFTDMDAIRALRPVIQALETYDVTTIRASIPMYILAEYIHQQGIKMCLSGEGSDEIFGGYLYFKAASSAMNFHQETVRLVKNLYLFDCLRANKSTMAHSVEIRPPFLDCDFVDYVMTIHPKYRMCPKGIMEKYVLRKAFEEANYIPSDVLWRQKSAFSDVGHVPFLKRYANEIISDKDFSRRIYFSYLTPETKEEYLYRKIFHELFSSKCKMSEQLVKEIWLPKSEWVGNIRDPSATELEFHENHPDYKKNID